MANIHNQNEDQHDVGVENRMESAGTSSSDPSGSAGSQEHSAEASRGVACGIRPSQDEVDEHERTHMPFRSWCKHCVFGKAKNDPHRKHAAQDATVPCISIDYMYMHEGRDREPSDQDVLPIIVMKDRMSKGVFAFVVPKKGECEYAALRAAQDLNKTLGYKKIILKGDQEPALRVLIDRIAKLCDAQVVQEESPVGESQSNGDVENAVQRVQGQYRTFRSDLESSYGREVPRDHPALTWLVRHASSTMLRYEMGSDGMTPYRRIKGKAFAAKICKFAECVWYLKPKTKGIEKAEYRWAEGIWLGIRDESGEHIIGTEGGIVKARTVRRPGSHGERWKWSVFEKMKGLPWEPVPGRAGFEIRTRVVDDVRIPRIIGQNEAAPREFKRRQFPIRKEDVLEHGITPGCYGCRSAILGQDPGKHKQQCRDRFEKVFIETGDVRLIRQLERFQDEEGEAPKEPEVPEEMNEENEIPRDDELMEDEDEGNDDDAIMNVASSINVVDTMHRMEKRMADSMHGRDAAEDVRRMHNELQNAGFSSPVLEVFSPARVNGIAHRMGAMSGMSLDLTTNDPDDGMPWDFNVPSKRQKALKMVVNKSAVLVIGSPVCTAFSRLQNWNFKKMDPVIIKKMIDEGTTHLKFCMELYRIQIDQGLYFLHEHPWSAKSWALSEVQNVLQDPSVVCVRGDMCCFGMYQDVGGRVELVKKPTGFMTNARAIAEELGIHCDGQHRHVHLLNGRAKRAEVYPDELCVRILRGLVSQMRIDGRIDQNGLCIMAEEEASINAVLGDGTAWDDVTGEELDHDAVKKARQDEMDEVHKHAVYVKVPVKDCWDSTGKAPIKTRWIDINKGDKVHPEYRSRIVAKDFKLDKRLDLFAATPPLEALKMLISIMMSEGIGWCKNHDERMKMDFIDIRRAYFHAESTRDVFIELPAEDNEVGMCGKLLKSMYGTRDAAQNWEIAYNEFMLSAGFSYGAASPCVFYNKDRDLRAVVHGDDFTVLGWESELNWFKDRIQERFEVKHRGRLGGDEGDVKSIRILNRIVTWKPDMIIYEPDQRHAEIIIRQMGLQNANSVSTPGVKVSGKPNAELDKPLNKNEASMYRGLAARANYLSQDRSDIKFAVKEISRRMSNPRVKDLQALKRLARYLIGCPRMVCEYRAQSMPKIIETWCDSDWAGCPDTRKSTSGGITLWGQHPIKAWSTTQNVIALSSGEAEYYALVKAGSQSIGIRSMLKDFGMKGRIKLITDASAAQGIAARRGLGQVKHIEVNMLWLQDKVNRNEIAIEKTGGKDNISDTLTKYMEASSLRVHIVGARIRSISGRHEIAPEVEDSINENVFQDVEEECPESEEVGQNAATV